MHASLGVRIGLKLYSTPQWCRKGKTKVNATQHENNFNHIVTCSVYELYDLYDCGKFPELFELYNVIEPYVFQNELLILSSMGHSSITAMAIK